MKKIVFVINNKGEEILYASLKKELKNQGVRVSIRRLKALDYTIKYVYPFMLV